MANLHTDIPNHKQNRRCSRTDYHHRHWHGRHGYRDK